jgi:hypothetical protein
VSLVVRAICSVSEVLRKRRLRDFRSRADYAPETVYRHRQHGWDYIPVHAFADEPDHLARLGLRPAECQSADAWWSTGEDATLLECRAGAQAFVPPGLYARQTDHPERWVYLLVSVDQPMITRSVVERAMTRFIELGFPSHECFRSSPDAGYVRISDWAP